MDPEHKRTRSLNDRDDLCDSVIGETLELGGVKSLMPTKIMSLIKKKIWPSLVTIREQKRVLEVKLQDFKVKRIKTP